MRPKDLPTRLLAATLAASLILLAPGFDFYRAFAAEIAETPAPIPSAGFEAPIVAPQTLAPGMPSVEGNAADVPSLDSLAPANLQSNAPATHGSDLRSASVVP